MNLVLLGGLVWNEWMPQPQVIAGGVLIALAWAATAAHHIRKNIATKELTNEELEDLFPLATVEYLRGNWFEVERLCQQLLKRDPGDMEARLLWATTCRHAQRHAEAYRQLEEMSLATGSEKWMEEIAGERNSLGRAAGDRRNPANAALAESEAADSETGDSEAGQGPALPAAA
ncbi:MAG TPA: hypothetical protein VHY20_13445 [Pirellulales bacterium]|nr:hypothetical protein [Pirellulales bacterium]